MQGSGGGPSEGNVSGYLVRSLATAWAKDSVLAVDAGTHLAGIIRILETHPIVASPSSTHTPDSISDEEEPDSTENEVSDSTTTTTSTATMQAASSSPSSSPLSSTSPSKQKFPFAGLQFPSTVPRANASYITRELVPTYLITHTHLDHLAGFVINTASFSPSDKPKRLAALPGSIKAVKNHIFNDVIWPNLSDEENGAGMVTYQRLSVGAEYVSVCEGLSTQAWPVSHGHCMKQHTHLGRKSNAGLEPEIPPVPQKKWCVIDSAVYFIRDEATGREVMMWGDVEPDSISLDPRNRLVWAEAARKICTGKLAAIFIECSYDSSQSDKTLYGHLSPRHLLDELLILASEITLCRSRKRKRQSNGASLPPHPPPPAPSSRKNSIATTPPPESLLLNDDEMMPPPIGIDMGLTISPPSPLFPRLTINPSDPPPLRGIKIVVTHVKDTLRAGDDVCANVLRDLTRLEKETGLGCEFTVVQQGDSIVF